MSKSFDELLEFPTLFVYRIIAYSTDDVESECRSALTHVFSRLEGCKVIPSTSGRFVRIQIAVTALSSDQLYRGYEVLKNIKDIRMVF